MPKRIVPSIPKKRIWGTITPELSDRLDTWSVKLGIPKAYLVTMCIEAGFDAVIRAVRPAESIKAEVMADILTAMKNKEMKIEVPQNGTTDRENSSEQS